jgi:hypothetical protein
MFRYAFEGDERDRISAPGDEPMRCLECDPGLAYPARTDDRDESCTRGEQVLDGGDLPVPTEHAAEGHGNRRRSSYRGGRDRATGFLGGGREQEAFRQQYSEVLLQQPLELLPAAEALV